VLIGISDLDGSSGSPDPEARRPGIPPTKILAPGAPILLPGPPEPPPASAGPGSGSEPGDVSALRGVPLAEPSKPHESGGDLLDEAARGAAGGRNP
jgi:hypothetical protein